MATPSLRQQTSFEGIIDPSAHDRFEQIMTHFDAPNTSPSSPRPEYSHVKLIRCTYNYALTLEAKGNLLRAFFKAVHLPLDQPIDMMDPAFEARLRQDIYDYADFLFNNFFLPMRASGPTPQSSNCSCQSQTEDTDRRDPTLRELCLERDKNRCIISGAFNLDEAERRYKEHPNSPCDDDGRPLTSCREFHFLEAAHVLPHSLVQEGKPDPLKKTALDILKMLGTIECTELDRPRNVITLTYSMHRFFSNFDVFLQPGQSPYEYRIGSYLHPVIRRNFSIPSTKTIYQHGGIEAPSSRLLEIHAAIAHILEHSGAGRYIDKILRDLDEVGIRADGSTELGRLVEARLQGWPLGVRNG
ncbi:hypothetical protein B0I35DRAFT_126784 [Stachybotrys elegans]|uniref:HNH nuclease domain-containing protein n=1 Tax=Stachybotrys elegans TaxID=80388 RepID=A0A8K0T0C8_9HYPO|nr:hypothetical protein B0I35DRAFT_126784 [Stachybotrys elegans]